MAGGLDMVDLYGQKYSRRDLAARCGTLSQFAGVQAYTLSDGVENGIRCLEFRTGTGFMFKVLVDRAMDVASAEYRGAAIGWHSPTGFRNPGLHEFNDEGGLSWLRSLSGLIVTCGLDHTLFMDSDTADHYHYGPRKTVDSSLHGRIGMIPARLTGYGEEWRGDDCYLWCEGVTVQATVFGEDLQLVRRIEAKVGESAFTINDRVINHGFYRTPHMFLYHINIGHPILSENSVYRAPIRETIWAAHAENLKDQGVGYLHQSDPKSNFHEQVFEHAIVADKDGKVPVALINRDFDSGRGIGFEVEFNKDEFPYMFQWQNYQEGLYAMAIEPSSNHVFGKQFAKERGELRWLEHGEEHAYTTRFRVLENIEQIDAAEKRISEICEQPDKNYPDITDNWDG
jgi:hypothetical protein